MSVNEELLPLRNKIDGLDSELVRLLNERAEVAKAIGEIKAKAGLPVLLFIIGTTVLFFPQ